KGDYPEAIKYYKKALAIEPQFQKALGNIGHVYEMMEEYDLAIDFYERSLEAKPENENLRFPDNIIPIIKDHLKKARESVKK
ncbi:MAG: tetratricopeptide repeat protein, partial [Candidatus Heimdallarchaeota archaeon]